MQIIERASKIYQGLSLGCDKTVGIGATEQYTQKLDQLHQIQSVSSKSNGICEQLANTISRKLIKKVLKTDTPSYIYKKLCMNCLPSITIHNVFILTG